MGAALVGREFTRCRSMLAKIESYFLFLFLRFGYYCFYLVLPLFCWEGG